ncbi:MAG: SRPBCC family protein [Prosthecobacter sp.]|nr:SRPBCC family protein [Prosthecobacter sp.]
MKTTAATSPSEIVSTRVFNTSRERLFEAFADPDQLVHWWGPKGFANTFETFDLRPGGEWRFTMHGPDGANYPIHKTFTEVVKPERIVFQHHDPVHRFQMTQIYTAEGARARLTWRMLFESAEEVTKLKTFITSANEENFDRLEAHLKSARNQVPSPHEMGRGLG